MIYEFKVKDIAEEFGVHRNTIRNWINSGFLPAKEGPGRKYLMARDDYRRLCEKFGRAPNIGSNNTLKNSPELDNRPSDIPRLILNTEKEKDDFDLTSIDACLGCGSCASLCPISGVDGLDPRKIVRMAILGQNAQLRLSSWQWKCTMCGKCEENCPASVGIVALIYQLRTRSNRTQTSAPIQRGITTCLERGNNLGIPKDDFIATCEELGKELGESTCPGFSTPIDVHGARVLVTVNSKMIFSEPDSLKWWWKIFYHAGESWTIPSENWDGVNWGMFAGDDEAMKTIVGRIIDNMRRLNCKVLLLPECGHAYYATRLGLNRWYPEALKEFQIVTVFDLLHEYLSTCRIVVDSSHNNIATTLHDSCNYGRKSFDAFGQAYLRESRAIIKSCCHDYRELHPHGLSSYCCGAGGGAWSMPFAEERVYYGRIKARQIEESGARLVIVSCHNCRDQIMKSLAKEYDLDIQVKYIWELIADSLAAKES